MMLKYDEGRIRALIDDAAIRSKSINVNMANYASTATGYRFSSLNNSHSHLYRVLIVVCVHHGMPPRKNVLSYRRLHVHLLIGRR